MTAHKPDSRPGWIAPLALVALIGGGGIGLSLLAGPGADDTNGAQALMQGARSELLRGTPDSIGRARDLFSEAAARDPGNAASHAQLALADLRLIDSIPRAAAEALPRAHAAATRAAELDPDLADAQAALGYTTFFWRGEWPAGMARLDRAVALDPASARARHWRGLALLHAGDTTRALADLDAAFRVAPGERAIIADRGLALVLAGRADQGLAVLRRLVREEPQYAGAARNLALALVARGDDAAWLEAEERAATLTGDSGWARAVAAGRDALANSRPAALAIMLERTSTPYPRARLLALLDRADEAIAALEQARRDPASRTIRIDPALASLRPDPRFQALSSSLG